MTEWPVRLRGVTETIVTTKEPNGKWNAAALGVHAPAQSAGADGASGETASRASSENGDAPATARTWGRTRTRRNFAERREGYVQFTPDPVAFVRAACSIHEVEEPILESTDAWARVAVERLDTGESGGTTWVEWGLCPEHSKVLRRRPFTANRGYYAVLEATVAASRLDVPAYETDVLLDRLDYFAGVCETCGGEREQEAFAFLDDLTSWRSY